MNISWLSSYFGGLSRGVDNEIREPGIYSGSPRWNV